MTETTLSRRDAQLKRRRVHWWCWQPTPYNAALFRALAQDEQIDLYVHFTQPSLTSHPWQSDLTQGYRSRCFAPNAALDWELLRLALTERHAMFVAGGWHVATLRIALVTLALRGHEYAIWTDTPVPPQTSSLKDFLRRRWMQWTFKHAKYVLGTGTEALRVLREIGCEARKLVNFPYFVDVDDFAPAARQGAAEIHLVSIGRLENPIKCYDLAIRAIAEVQRRLPGLNLIYTLAGDGRDRRALEDLAALLGVQDIVRFAGWLEPEQVTDLLRRADVLLHPARFEPYGVAVLEAMAAGVVVIASSSVAAAIDRIRQGENGFLHGAGNFNELAACIERVVTDPAEMDRLKKNARATAEQWPLSRAVEIIRDVIATDE